MVAFFVTAKRLVLRLAQRSILKQWTQLTWIQVTLIRHSWNESPDVYSSQCKNPRDSNSQPQHMRGNHIIWLLILNHMCSGNVCRKVLYKIDAILNWKTSEQNSRQSPDQSGSSCIAYNGPWLHSRRVYSTIHPCIFLLWRMGQNDKLYRFRNYLRRAVCELQNNFLKLDLDNFPMEFLKKYFFCLELIASSFTLCIKKEIKKYLHSRPLKPQSHWATIGHE